ncbi:MAG: phenylalanine--tRNA ligase subunit beta [Bacteroidales bacterium]|nr:phenylalanine--tRNA ligase subunit beta [Bacteroidales bacterium]
MNISFNWLKKYLKADITADELCSLLTSIGLEVDSWHATSNVKGGLEGLVIGKVLTCEPHPDSDHMHVTTVDVGSGAPLNIVCGAPNIAAGQTVVVATIGTVLYDGDKEFVIKKSKLRGVPSEGMICAEDEIGIGNDHSGIIVLPNEVPVGTLAKNYFDIGADTLIEVDITPNRGDAASHYGVARDVRAALLARGKAAEVERPSVDDFKVDSKSTNYTVEVQDTTACPRYSCAVVSGVTIKESPDWLQKALRAIGLTPINNVVDVSNYILFGLGQPLHTFDADKIEGGKVIVGHVAEGTKFKTLDGVERSLSADDLMICNAKGPMCIAGVFGGVDSGITEGTKNVLIESAWFNGVSIRKTARRHQLSTDASFRFERGTDPNGVLYALKRAAMLIKEVAGGEISQDIIDEYPEPVKPFEVKVSRKRLTSLIGKAIEEDRLQKILAGLEMTVKADDGDVLTLDVPRYRVDVMREADVAEDVLRLYGYDNIELPQSSNVVFVEGAMSDRTTIIGGLADMLASRGYIEIMNNTLTKASQSTLLPESCPEDKTVRLANPLSSDLSVLRQTLVIGALETVARNRNHRNPNLRLFELGNVQSKKPGADAGKDTTYVEEYHISMVQSGLKAEPNWNTTATPVSLFDLKADVEALLRKLGIAPAAISEESISDDMFETGIKIAFNGGKQIGRYGLLRSSLAAAFDVNAPVYYAEFDAGLLATESAKRNKVHFTELPKYPEVKRDLALLVDNVVTFGEIRKVAEKAEKKILRNVYLFDVYEGKNLPEGKKSYAVSFILRDDEHTLTDKQIEKSMNSITMLLQKELGATLR